MLIFTVRDKGFRTCYACELVWLWFMNRAWNLILLNSTKHARTYALKKGQIYFKNLDLLFFAQNVHEYRHFIKLYTKVGRFDVYYAKKYKH